ncbi:MAG: NADH-quinone oxidoreductase subunit F, partial [Nitrospirae bacterium]|nr:NADH-quinone oxidoreductase subunit F [Nitrospirota bacterium]
MSIAVEPRLVQKLEGAPWDIEGYLKVGGYEAWKRCVKESKAVQVVDELKKSGLRGRGG